MSNDNELWYRAGIIHTQRAKIERLREALQEAADMTEDEADRTLIFKHCMLAAEAGGKLCVN